MIGGWRDGRPALRTHRLIEVGFGRAAVFTVGSTREEVLAVQPEADRGAGVVGVDLDQGVGGVQAGHGS